MEHVRQELARSVERELQFLAAEREERARKIGLPVRASRHPGAASHRL